MRGGLALATAFALALAACGGGGSVLTAGERPSAAEALARAQQALEAVAGYRIDVTGHNLVLPRWGGIDAATLNIASAGPAVSGSLNRTGDGVYSISYVDRQTYFQRSTCDHFARVPGGGDDVLRPFLWGRTGALGRGGNPALVPGAAGDLLVVEGDIADLGRVQVELDPATYRPLRLVQPRQPNGGESIWTFSAWGNAPDVQLPPGRLADQGPGGNPC